MNASSSMTKYTAALCLCAAGTIASASVVETGFHREVHSFAQLGLIVDQYTDTDTSGYGEMEIQQYAGAFGPTTGVLSNSYLWTSAENGHYRGSSVSFAVADSGGLSIPDAQTNGYSEMIIDFSIHGTETYSFSANGLINTIRSQAHVYMAIESLSSPIQTDRVFFDLTLTDAGAYNLGIPGRILSTGTLTDGDYRFVLRTSMDLDTTLDNNNSLAYGGSSEFDFHLDITTNSVPVPSTMAILGLGGLVAGRRRR